MHVLRRFVFQLRSHPIPTLSSYPRIMVSSHRFFSTPSPPQPLQQQPDSKIPQPSLQRDSYNSNEKLIFPFKLSFEEYPVSDTAKQLKQLILDNELQKAVEIFKNEVTPEMKQQDPHITLYMLCAAIKLKDVDFGRYVWKGIETKFPGHYLAWITCVRTTDDSRRAENLLQTLLRDKNAFQPEKYDFSDAFLLVADGYTPKPNMVVMFWQKMQQLPGFSTYFTKSISMYQQLLLAQSRQGNSKAVLEILDKLLAEKSYKLNYNAVIIALKALDNLPDAQKAKFDFVKKLPQISRWDLRIKLKTHLVMRQSDKLKAIEFFTTEILPQFDLHKNFPGQFNRSLMSALVDCKTCNQTEAQNKIETQMKKFNITIEEIGHDLEAIYSPLTKKY